jgi:hypothetical protein
MSYVRIVYKHSINMYANTTVFVISQAITQPHTAVGSESMDDSSTALSTMSIRSARLAIFWNVVAIGSRILGASRDTTETYRARAATALRNCFDEGDAMVVQAYMLLGTLETMLGNAAKARRYLHFAETVHAGLRKKKSAAAAVTAAAVTANAATGNADSTGSSSSSSGSSGLMNKVLYTEDDVLETVLCVFGPRIHDANGLDVSTLTEPHKDEHIQCSSNDVVTVSQLAQEGSAIRPIDALRLAVGLKSITHKV